MGPRLRGDDAKMYIPHAIPRRLLPAPSAPALAAPRRASMDPPGRGALGGEVAAEVAAGYQRLAVLRAEVDELRAELKRRRALEAKYSPSQPRVLAGNPRGGQWTDRSGGQGTVAGPSQDTGQSQDAN